MDDTSAAVIPRYADADKKSSLKTIAPAVRPRTDKSLGMIQATRTRAGRSRSPPGFSRCLLVSEDVLAARGAAPGLKSLLLCKDDGAVVAPKAGAAPMPRDDGREAVTCRPRCR